MTAFESHIMKFSPEIQHRLIYIRQTALDAFGEIEERTCHGLPAFFRNGQVILFYGGYKKHISMCIGEGLVDFLKNQYPGLGYTQHTIIFSHNEPFPEDVIPVICRLIDYATSGGSHPPSAAR